MVPWCKKTEVVENVGVIYTGKALTACQHGWYHQIWTGFPLDTSSEMYFDTYVQSAAVIVGEKLLYLLPPLCYGTASPHGRHPHPIVPSSPLLN